MRTVTLAACAGVIAEIVPAMAKTARAIRRCIFKVVSSVNLNVSRLVHISMAMKMKLQACHFAPLSKWLASSSRHPGRQLESNKY